MADDRHAANDAAEADSEQINADMLAFWNGQGGRTWVARQAHTDITLRPVTQALLDFAAPLIEVPDWRSSFGGHLPKTHGWRCR